MKDLGATDAVLNPHPDARHRLIGRFLLRCQLAFGRTFLGLIGSYLGRFIALKTSILVQFGARWEAVLLLIGGSLVAGLPWSRAAQRLNLAGSAVADDHILDRMALFLAAVEVALARLVLWALDWSLGSIDDEF